MAPLFDRCNLSVILDDFALLLQEFYQRNPLGEHVFILTLYYVFHIILDLI